MKKDTAIRAEKSLSIHLNMRQHCQLPNAQGREMLRLRAAQTTRFAKGKKANHRALHVLRKLKVRLANPNPVMCMPLALREGEP